MHGRDRESSDQFIPWRHRHHRHHHDGYRARYVLEISEAGYDAFVKYSMDDVNVKNAVINALYDEMEEAQRRAVEGGEKGE